MVLAGLQNIWRPLHAQLFPRLVMLDLSERLVLGQPVKRGQPQGPACSLPSNTWPMALISGCSLGLDKGDWAKMPIVAAPPPKLV